MYEKSVCPRTGKARRCARPSFYILYPPRASKRDVLSREEDSGDKTSFRGIEREKGSVRKKYLWGGFALLPRLAILDWGELFLKIFIRNNWDAFLRTFSSKEYL